MSSSSSSGVTVSALNIAGLLRGDGGEKKRINLSELGLDCEHSVIRLSAITTKFGRAILCELKDNSVILPLRFATALSDGDLEVLNKKPLFLVYKGSSPTKYGPTSLIEFREKSQQQQQ